VSNDVPPFRERLLDNICQFDYIYYLAFTIEVLLLIGSLVSYLFGDLDEQTRNILILDFILLGVLFALTTSAIYICSRRS